MNEQPTFCLSYIFSTCTMCPFWFNYKMILVLPVNIKSVLCFFGLYFLDLPYLLLQDIQKFKLGNPREFHYLNQTDCFELEGVDESKEYRDTRRAMDVVGISSEEQVFYWSFCKFVNIFLKYVFQCLIVFFVFPHHHCAGCNISSGCCNFASWQH